ncbi:MAG TPA: YkgJ family cysteine cluster protein [Treponemataceae bacterium]|nr:YkgJ family cysteine cluster protein [Treponemataceae bacterium]
MIPEYKRIIDGAKAREKETLRRMTHLAKFNRSGFDDTLRGYHKEAFARIDCLKCGNCCRALGPRFADKDVKRIAKEIGLSPKAYFERYLQDDRDPGFYVLREPPCPYLNDDNTCAEFDCRPEWCGEFPHTDSHNAQRHLVRLAYSALVCPAAAIIAQRVIEEY